MDKRYPAQHYSPYLNSIGKRYFDIVVCLIFIVSIFIVLLFIISLVLVVDGRPALFFQKRISKGGMEFLMPKICTLKKNAYPNKAPYSYDIDVFTTKTGKFLRRHRLDELPQIFSILTGKMSFVEPRPELVDIVKSYTSKELKRLCSQPGLTGLWQIKAPHNQPIHKNIRYGLYYIRHANLWLDIRILIETIPFIFVAKREIINEKNRLYPYNLPLPE